MLEQNILHDFSRNSASEIEKEIIGKIIVGFEVPDEGWDDWLIFRFADGTSLRLRYDWIYEWCIMKAK